MPNDHEVGSPTFIATAVLDDESSRRLTQLRSTYFPPHRNFLDAHITLFHKLTVEGLATLELAMIEAGFRCFEVKLGEAYALGFGVAIRIESSQLVALRNQLAVRLHADLSAQDRQPYKPHVTIQNKVTAAEARASLVEIRRAWSPSVARVDGIDLWEYLGGPWGHHSRLTFSE